MFTAKNYIKPSSLEEAWQLNQKKSNVIVGGMHWLKMSSNPFDTVIDLSGLGLDSITETENEFIIGSMCTLRDLELSEELNRYTGNSVYEAVRHIVGVQFRNTATVGGSLYGRYGFSDILTVFIALDSFVELYRGGTVPLSEYASRNWDRDIIVSLIIKKSGIKECFKCSRNTKTDFSVLNVAACRKPDNTFRIAIGARPHRAVIVEESLQIGNYPKPAAETLPGVEKMPLNNSLAGANCVSGIKMPLDGNLAGGIDDSAIRLAAKAVAEKVILGSNQRGSKEYRRRLAEILCFRAISECISRYP